MSYFADLHVHSKYSRATSGDCDLEHLSLWAQKKGITVVASGDFTHPAWASELADKLVPAEPGLYRLREDSEREVSRMVPPSCRSTTRFLLSVEISTIYKQGERTRKVHHLIYVPDLTQAAAVTARLGRIGNIAADGRPILGLPSRDLLEIVLDAAPDGFLVPAHIWTPWFSVLGAKSGFDSIAECYGDLAKYIFAAETGLSSDPEMNWRLSALDGYRLMSSSDAHSPHKLGREACVFDTAIDYFAMRRALMDGEGYAGTVEFFPEEGKYHLDGHATCKQRLTPEETRAAHERCPTCGKAVTVGVLHRVEALADRPSGTRPARAADFVSLVPLCEMLGEVLGVGANTKGVQRAYEHFIDRLGPELTVLTGTPLADVQRRAGSWVAEALRRVRCGEVTREAGYDGEYGVIRVFAAGEVAHGAGRSLFPTVDAIKSASASTSPMPPTPDSSVSEGDAKSAEADMSKRAVHDIGSGLDSDQCAAVTAGEGALVIIAGPGAGKTRTLTHRIAWLVRKRGVAPRSCLAITFTRRAAAELNARLVSLLGAEAQDVTVGTLHAFGLSLLREHDGLGAPPRFRVIDEHERDAVLAQVAGSAQKARAAGKAIAAAKRDRTSVGEDFAPVYQAYQAALRAQGAVDFEDLVSLPVELLSQNPELRAVYRQRYRFVFVDELQDVDTAQYELLRALVAQDGNLCAIGDPDQSIYGFRGADAGVFARVQRDYPAARVFRLERTYRATRVIADVASQLIARATRVPGRKLVAVAAKGPNVTVHEAASDGAEAEHVVRSIEELLGGHSFFSKDSGRGAGDPCTSYAFGDFAVLYRTDVVAEPLRQALARSGMPYLCLGHDALTREASARGIAKALASESPSLPLSQRLDHAFGALGAAAMTPVLAALRAELALVARRADATVEELLDVVATANAADAVPRADRISLLTLHAAKGLEFRVVFIVGCEDGLLPLRFGDSPVDDEEERRLLFVGASRAQERLVLSHAKKRWWRGSVRETLVSPFLRDIDRGLIDFSVTPLAKKHTAPPDRQLTLF